MLKLMKRKGLLRDNKGTTLIEVVIALIVLAMVVGSVLTAMTVIFNSQTRQDQQRIAEFLTRNEFEYVKGYTYQNATGVGSATYPSLGFEDISVYNATAIGYIINPDNPAVDVGIQRIVVNVYSKDILIMSTIGYKVAR